MFKMFLHVTSCYKRKKEKGRGGWPFSRGGSREIGKKGNNNSGGIIYEKKRRGKQVGNLVFEKYRRRVSNLGGGLGRKATKGKKKN